MKNELGLPDWLVESVEKTRNEYDAGEATDYSITSLLKPPMIMALENEFSPESDVADNLQSFIGTACHSQLEKTLKNNPRYLVEERLYYELEIPEAPSPKKKFILSAQLDMYDMESKQLWDFKFSKMYSFLNSKFEYSLQLGFQRFLLEREGYEVDQSFIGGFALDWSKRKGRYDKSYPKSLMIPTPYPEWSDEDLIAELKRRVLDLEHAKMGRIRLCDDSERWKIADEYVVKKKGNKNAIRNSKTTDRAVAEMMVADLGEGHYVEERIGDDVRCMDFCNVREHCDYWKEKYG